MNEENKHEIDPETGLPIGTPVENAGPAIRPQRIRMEGRYITVSPLDPGEHALALWEGAGGDQNRGLWRYLFDGPFADYAAFSEVLKKKAASEDPLFFAVTDNRSERALGYASFMRIEPAHRCIEVGSILYTPALQRTRGATEAMYLMARHVFDELGYRRYEWKCDALNKISRRAALRLGFQFEGIFRQHMIVKGRNRDTAWFAMLDSEWRARRKALEDWLDPSNFDETGQQRSPLNLNRVF